MGIRIIFTLVAMLPAALPTMLWAAPVRAGDNPLRARAEVSANSLNVAQRTVLTVVCEVAQGWALVDDPFDTLGVDDPLGPLLVASTPRMAPARYESGRTEWRWVVELAPDLPETGEIPALRFKAELIGGDRIAVARTESIPVVVESLLIEEIPGWDPTALREPLGPIEAPGESHAALVVSLGVLAVVGAGALTISLVNRRRRDPGRIRAARFGEFRSALSAIDTGAPVEEVAQAAQAVVRQAMAEVAGPRALAATGEELVPLLRVGVGLSPTDVAVVADFLARVDAVLYAGGAISSGAAGPLRDDAVRTVECVHLAAAAAGRWGG